MVLLVSASGVGVVLAVVVVLAMHVAAARRRAEETWPAPLISAAQARLSGLPRDHVTGHVTDPDEPLNTDPDH